MIEQVGIIEHQISLRFETEAHGVSFDNEMRMLDDTENIPGWMIKDDYGFSNPQYDIYQPDFDAAEPEDNLGSDASVWVLTFGSKSQIPLTSSETKMTAFDAVHHLVQHVAKYFPNFKYIRSTEFKKFSYTEQNNLEF